MADLQITDEFGLSASLELRDDSPLAKAKITRLSSINQALEAEFDKPIDQTSLKEFTIGVDCSTPNATIGGMATISVGAAVCGTVSIRRPVDKTLFPHDSFSLDITIAPDQCWMGVELDGSVDTNVQAKADGFGVGIKDIAKIGLTTYTLLEASQGKLPVFKDGLKMALDGFYLACGADALRMQPTGSVCVNELSGTVTFTGPSQLPISVSALATADLPFNYKISV